MFQIIGIVIVFGSIIVGYIMEEGNFSILMQPAELVIIGGCAFGAFVISCKPALLIKIFKILPTIVTGKSPGKKTYLALLSLLYTLFTKIKKEGLLAVEGDIENPEKSALFRKYPEILKNHHAVDFICDNLRVFVIGVKPMDLEELMEVEMDSHHEESALPHTMITKVADALPGFGIVAAVLGVVITMGKMDEGPEAIGHSVAAALVGTFLGILLCYGLVGPLGTFLENRTNEESKFFEAIRSSIMAFAKDFPPQIAVEAGRRAIFSDSRPSFKELEAALRKSK